MGQQAGITSGVVAKRGRRLVRSRRFAGATLVVLGLVSGLAWLTGCQAPAERVRPAKVRPPVTSQPSEPPSATEAPVPATAPEPPLMRGVRRTNVVEPPDLPDYITVLERFQTDEPARVELAITSPERLVIDTQNVRRLRVDRQRLPMNTRRSIVLRLDGQGIEWTADSDVSEFERSVNGEWTPARKRSP